MSGMNCSFSDDGNFTLIFTFQQEGEVKKAKVSVSKLNIVKKEINFNTFIMRRESFTKK